MSEKVLHTKYRYKPDGSDNYVTIYIENSADDVMVDATEDGIIPEGTLAQAITQLVAILQTKALAPIYMTRRELIAEDPIVGKGQLAIESDTNRIKIGNGFSNYSLLSYASGTDADTVNSNVTVVLASADKFISSNMVIPLDYYAIEADTFKLKHGDGVTNYNDLVYLPVSRMTATDASATADGIRVFIGNASELEKSYYIPSKGQYIVELNTGKYKVGDGYTKYSALQYANGETIKIDDVNTSVMTPVFDTEENASVSNKILANGQIAITTSVTQFAKIGTGVSAYNSLPNGEIVAVADDEEEFSSFDVTAEGEDILNGGLTISDTTVIPADDIVINNYLQKFLRVGDGTSKMSEIDTSIYDDQIKYGDTSSAKVILWYSIDLLASSFITPLDAIIIELDTGKYKIGDGKNRYENLAYVGAGTLSAAEVNGVRTGVVFDVEENMSTSENVLANGQVAISTNVISTYKRGDGETKYDELEQVDFVGTDEEVDYGLDIQDMQGRDVFNDDEPLDDETVVEENELVIDGKLHQYIRVGDGITPMKDLDLQSTENRVTFGDPGIKMIVDISSNFSAINPTLGYSTFGLETNTSKVKVGDAETEWNVLPYVKTISV